jgi:lysozyme family protein
MTTSFEDSMLFLKRWEGGYVADPDDHGGETKYGISKRSYPYLDIRNLTWKDVKLIYLKDYWKPMKCDEMQYPLARAVFDYGVNSGKSRSIKTLQLILNVMVDGVIGPKTLAAIHNIDQQSAAETLILNRVEFLIQLTQRRPSDLKYLKGWMFRTHKLCLEIGNA